MSTLEQRNARTLASAQEAYDARQPPEFYEPEDFEDRSQSSWQDDQFGNLVEVVYVLDPWGDPFVLGVVRDGFLTESHTPQEITAWMHNIKEELQ